MEKYIVRALLLALILPVAISCAYAPPKYEFEDAGIYLHIEGDKQLNLKDGTSHTLSLCVYQLKDPNAFKQLLDTTDGLYKLLECGVFDSGVAVTKRIIVHPKEDMRVVLDRAEGAQYVAIVAGYYNVDKDRIVRFFRVPLKKRGIFNRELKPDNLYIHLVLGPQQIVKAEEDKEEYKSGENKEDMQGDKKEKKKEDKKKDKQEKKPGRDEG